MKLAALSDWPGDRGKRRGGGVELPGKWAAAWSPGSGEGDLPNSYFYKTTHDLSFYILFMCNGGGDSGGGVPKANTQKPPSLIGGKGQAYTLVSL